MNTPRIEGYSLYRHLHDVTFFTATCDGLPFELTNMKLDSIVGTSDCSGTEIDGMCDISCSDYSYLRGSTYATCEINYEDNSAEWKIPEGVDEPECEGKSMFLSRCPIHLFWHHNI